MLDSLSRKPSMFERAKIALFIVRVRLRGEKIIIFVCQNLGSHVTANVLTAGGPRLTD